MVSSFSENYLIYSDIKLVKYLFPFSAWIAQECLQSPVHKFTKVNMNSIVLNK